MRRAIFSMTGALLAILSLPSQSVCAGSEIQNILINERLQVPGAVLEPGKYSLSIEASFYDRLIVAITQNGRNERHRVLAVPNAAMKNESTGGLVFFRQGGDRAASLKGWNALEFVYPKDTAILICGDSGQTVLAVDPAADKLPIKMTAEEMKRATLWSLAPKQLTSDNHGMGVTATKYASASDSSATIAALMPPSAAGPAAVTTGKHKKLPKTASNNYTNLLYGAILLSLAAGMRSLRVRQELAR